jgi:hypothetical protein
MWYQYPDPWKQHPNITPHHTYANLFKFNINRSDYSIRVFHIDCEVGEVGKFNPLRATSQTILRPVTIRLEALSLVGKSEPVQVHFTLCWRDQRSTWMQDGCKVHMYSYMASNGSGFMVTWTTFKNNLLEVRLTQNRKIMALQTLTTIGLFYFIIREDPHE